jgi:hypothetical protein
MPWGRETFVKKLSFAIVLFLVALGAILADIRDPTWEAKQSVIVFFLVIIIVFLLEGLDHLDTLKQLLGGKPPPKPERPRERIDVRDPADGSESAIEHLRRHG